MRQSAQRSAELDLMARWHRPRWKHRFFKDVWREVREKEMRLEQQEYRRLWDQTFTGGRYKQKGTE